MDQRGADKSSFQQRIHCRMSELQEREPGWRMRVLVGEGRHLYSQDSMSLQVKQCASLPFLSAKGHSAVYCPALLTEHSNTSFRKKSETRKKVISATKEVKNVPCRFRDSNHCITYEMYVCMWVCAFIYHIYYCPFSFST